MEHMKDYTVEVPASLLRDVLLLVDDPFLSDGALRILVRRTINLYFDEHPKGPQFRIMGREA